MNCKDKLRNILQTDPKSCIIPSLIEEFEFESRVDLETDLSLLKGAWELRCSSSTQPWLKQAPWLENLQILDPVQKKGVNLLRLSAPIGSVVGIAVEAELSINSSNQVGVQFKRGGWLGPSLGNGWRPKLLATINQSFPAWLDITGLDDSIRICRGNAGTCFALIKRTDLAVHDWIPQSIKKV